MTGDIVDVDFRYVTRVVPAHIYGENIGLNATILQWRKKITAENDELSPPVGFVVRKIEWTDWQDVRTEVE